MMHSKRFLSSSLTAILAVGLAGLSRAAAPEALCHLDFTAASDFSSAIAALAKQSKITVIAEGVPLHSHLSPQEAAKLTAPMSLDHEMKAVADAYDYSVQSEGKVFILKKRYTDPNDMPVLSPAECEQSLVLLQQISEPFNSHSLSTHIQFLAPPGPNLRRDQVQILHPTVDAFAASLTPNQMTAMQKGKLLVSSLSQDQKKMALQIRLSLYIQHPMDRTQSILPLIKQADKDAVFCWDNATPTQQNFGYILPEQTGHTKSRFHPLDHSTGLEDFNNFSGSQAEDANSKNSDIPPVITEQDTAETLADAVAALKKRPGTVLNMDVDASVAMKPVTVAGIENASAKQVFQALAEVYGLRVTETPVTHSALLTLPEVAPPSQLSDLPAFLRKALPEPFFRAAHLQEAVNEEQNFYDFWQTPRFPKKSTKDLTPPIVEEDQQELEKATRERKRANAGLSDIQAELNRIKLAKARLPALRFAAIRQLDVLIKPKLQIKPEGIPISELSDQEHQLLATTLLVEVVNFLGDLITQKVPDTALNFDQASLSGGVKEGLTQASFSIQFHIPNPPGGLEVDGGGIGVPYYKPSAQ